MYLFGNINWWSLNFLCHRFLIQEYVQNEEKNEKPFDINDVTLLMSAA